jgi:catechol 2,3-dioxygenase-like lactoylglutathione lyase family enzyme
MSPDSGPTGSPRTSEAVPIPPAPPSSPLAEPDPGQAPAWPERGVTEAAERVVTGTIHHIEFWVPDLDRAIASWGWLLDELGYKPFGDWPGGRSWRAGSTYIVLEQSPDRTASRHDRCRPGLNHLAFHVADQEQVEKLVAVAPTNGWRLMFADRHPYAGGEGHYAAYLENADGFEAELVAPSHHPAPGGG